MQNKFFLRTKTQLCFKQKYNMMILKHTPRCNFTMCIYFGQRSNPIFSVFNHNCDSAHCKDAVESNHTKQDGTSRIFQANESVANGDVAVGIVVGNCSKHSAKMECQSSETCSRSAVAAVAAGQHRCSNTKEAPQRAAPR